MVYLRNTIAVLTFLFISCSGAKYASEPILEIGVSKKLAVYRKSVISNISYKLELDIPRDRNEIINAIEELTFQLGTIRYPLQIDFRENAKKIKILLVNGVNVEVNHKDEHLIIDAKYLKQGANVIGLNFEAGETALNRNSDYLYTLFVPDRARTIFPCFDQPDLKATYNLTLKIPTEWKAMANGTLKDSVITGDRKTYHFNTSDIMSTYLFAFAVGKFTLAQGKIGDMRTDFLYRETDPWIIKNSLNEVFNIHTKSLSFLENWTGIPYPFQKFGFVAIPDFQFGGMEHVGAIQYKSSALFLDEGATKDQLNARNNLIAHETAHMWFGDLVTMNWFTDVWMKEVFANFMADKSTEDITGREVFDLKFLTDHFPAAYGVDRTKGSNPIRQDLDNLKDAGSLYGNIIYHKAPIVMRQLERLMGREKFQVGVREYLKEFTNNNASWPDLITVLDKYADADLQKWNKVWVNEAGRPVIDYTIEKAKNKIKKFVITQTSEYGSNRIWPQLIEVTLYYPDRSEELTVNLNSKNVELKAAKGMEVPSFVLFNSSGLGYGLWPLDKAIFNEIYLIKRPVDRSSTYISLYENMLIGRYIKPLELLSLFIKGLDLEKEELNLKLITNYISNIYWEFISVNERAGMSASLENVLWSSIQKQSLPNNKKVLFKTYQDVYQSAEVGKRLNEIWKNQKPPAGIKLTEDDYTSLAFSLVLRDGDSSILNQQLKRIVNLDRRKRFEFIMPAVSSSVSKRDNFFKSLELKSNRDKESNVGAALYYLHHPLRQKSSFKYLEKSLDMLVEIQKTGDIFFPQNWLQATFGYYQSKEALMIVQDFLKRNPYYNPKLKAKILQCSDNLFRAQKLIIQ